MQKTYSTKHCHVRRVDGAAIIRPHGNLMGGEETEELEKLIDDFNAEGLSCLIVNLIDVGFMNTLGITRFVAGHMKFARRGARMCLCNLDAKIQNILVITKLTLVLHVYPDEKSALAGSSAQES